ncbi:MAG TPA: sugar transferase [Rubrobacteraceae bacterium]|nr:sugar transferase [Rubrobacteraceae bacterium]
MKTLLYIKTLRRILSVSALLLADAAALVLGLAGSALLIEGETSLDQALYLAPALLAVWITLLAAFHLYDRARVRRNPGALLAATLSWTGIALAGVAIYPESGLRAAGVVVAASLSLLVSGALRLLYEQGIEMVYRRGFALAPMVIIGNATERERIRRMMLDAPGAYPVVGEIDLQDSVDLAALRQLLDGTQARGVILAGAERLADEDLLDLMRSVRLRGIRMRAVPGALTLLRNQPILSQSMGLPLLEVRYPRLDNTQRAMKRALDITLSAAGLIFLSPLFLAISLAIRLDSPGPAFFRQKRAGVDEKVFICYMFRSMYEDAESRQEEVEALNEADGPVFKMKRDPRVTPVGRFLRRWSIDELPQLINVLKGEMSLVGPRPLPLRDFERMGELHKRRLAAIPGMTGYWQISGRSNLSFEEMVRLDLYYIENWSLSFDLKIILRTLGAVLRREGAY